MKWYRGRVSERQKPKFSPVSLSLDRSELLKKVRNPRKNQGEDLSVSSEIKKKKKPECAIYHACCVLSCLSCIWLLVIPWTVAHQAPLSMEFSRQEYWSGLHCPPPGDLPDLGIEPTSLTSPALAGRFFTTGATCEASWVCNPNPKDTTC